MRHRLLAVLAIASAAVTASFDAVAQPAYSAAFVSEIAPFFVETKTTAPVSITMRNTGTATWLRNSLDVYLATQEPQDNFYWCIQGNRYLGIEGNRVVLPHDVAPNEEVTFEFLVKPLACRFAPYSPLRFRMLSALHGTFGDETPDLNVVVSTVAEFASQQVPTAVPAGASILATVTYKNTSPIAWPPGDFLLAEAPATGAPVWGVAPVVLATAVEPGDMATFEFYLVAPAKAGTYNFQWQMQTLEGASFGEVSPATPVSVVTGLLPNYQGLWWNQPAESEAGWGINFAHQGATIFATWFTYDASGKALWATMTAPIIAAGVYSGTLVTYTGPPFNAVPFSPLRVKGTRVGIGTLTFADVNTGTFAYTINGVTQTKKIVRQAFGPLPTCTFGLITNLTQAYNYQDLWWAAPAGVESGWGVNLAHQGDTIFATWFTYDLDGTPMWLSVTAPKTAAGAYGGTLYRTTGPAYNAVPFLPSAVVRTEVGTAAFAFTDGNTGTFAYTVNGVSQTKPITREVFQSPGTVCQ